MKKNYLGILAFIFIAIFGGIIYIKTALPAIGKPEEITLDNSNEQIERGKYLANSVCACMDCHPQENSQNLPGLSNLTL